MGYGTSIAEAISRMGNARAQGELQKGQIYGNMAQNLGQIPGQTMQFAEGLQSANQNQQIRKLQIESMQREAEFEKQAMAIVNDPSLSPQMKDQQMENLLRQHPDKWERYQNSREIRLLREQSAAEHFNKSRETMPGTVAPAEGFALPEPTTGKTMPGGGVANAFAPVTPIEEQLVHPTIKSPMGPLNALTRYQIRGEKQEDLETTGARKLEQDKELAKYKQGLKPETKRNVTATELYQQDPEAYQGMRETDEAARAKYRRPLKEGGGGASTELKSKQTRLAIKQKKERKLADLEKQFKASNSPGAMGKSNPMAPEELQQRKDQIQQEFLDDLEIAGLGTTPGPQAAEPASQERIVQRNKRTGAIRHSDDGGVTWQPGP